MAQFAVKLIADQQQEYGRRAVQEQNAYSQRLHQMHRRPHADKHEAPQIVEQKIDCESGSVAVAVTNNQIEHEQNSQMQNWREPGECSGIAPIQLAEQLVHLDS